MYYATVASKLVTVDTCLFSICGMKQWRKTVASQQAGICYSVDS